MTLNRTLFAIPLIAISAAALAQQPQQPPPQPPIGNPGMVHGFPGDLNTVPDRLLGVQMQPGHLYQLQDSGKLDDVTDQYVRKTEKLRSKP
jgi:hypothetical protein